MVIYFIIVGVVLFGIGFVIVLLRHDAMQEKRGAPEQVSLSGLSAPPEPPEPAALKTKKSLFAGFSFGKKKRAPQDKMPSLQPLTPEEFNAMSAPAPGSEPTTSTTKQTLHPVSSLEDQTQPLSAQEEQSIDKEIDAALQLDELKEKSGRVEKLLKERTEELERARELLECELRNKKEFNKVKDILEKELRDVKDNSRKTQNKLTAAQTETETCRKRIEQLEEKITKLEKDVLEKETEIANLARKPAAAPEPTAEKPSMEGGEGGVAPDQAIPPAPPEPVSELPGIPEPEPPAATSEPNSQEPSVSAEPPAESPAPEPAPAEPKDDFQYEIPKDPFNAKSGTENPERVIKILQDTGFDASEPEMPPPESQTEGNLTQEIQTPDDDRPSVIDLSNVHPSGNNDFGLNLPPDPASEEDDDDLGKKDEEPS